MVEKPVPTKSTFWIVFTVCFNACMQLVLVEQTDNAEVGGCQKKYAYCLHVNKLILPFLDAEMLGCSKMSYLVSASYP